MKTSRYVNSAKMRMRQRALTVYVATRIKYKTAGKMANFPEDNLVYNIKNTTERQ